MSCLCGLSPPRSQEKDKKKKDSRLPFSLWSPGGKRWRRRRHLGTRITRIPTIFEYAKEQRQMLGECHPSLLPTSSISNLSCEPHLPPPPLFPHENSNESSAIRALPHTHTHTLPPLFSLPRGKSPSPPPLRPKDGGESLFRLIEHLSSTHSRGERGGEGTDTWYRKERRE